ncbi:MULTISPECIES: type II toxin-antitoxin system HicB family antitoxin [Aerococcus]|uniref:Type II toxin-antitoxin system HicB family antitoxin n=2 Tax=Aerococcus TaxID=1375 RepID=A0A178HEH5_9LACT|nr:MULTISPECIES: type II toxin-antitoxin system HicB family antitoxin [Aerococcus]KAA9220467.1 type II toxin-antitoxin system HicB family antitoxin [Aerococcus loyolae]KAA9265599.1 type II toxin-antitoxin system HicB family antitoxin [Aerococcus loyolae]MCY3025667.1 type II toxin-antitoxin system HicB family antitoxin [Aerococcus loyolae]MCY3027315.1 type II toxin-antitoxin system HicB family antitoxin [Aerococcus loyolae]MCY3028936.1 type II toxin-antitoxin system HicB family antitoxin [Aeroc
MKRSYPALFYFDKEFDGYFISFPDLNDGATQGESISDALYMASEYLGIVLGDALESNKKIPQPSNINDLSLIENYPFKEDTDWQDDYDMGKSFISMVVTDVSEYLNLDELVDVSLSIPRWAESLAILDEFDLSKLLTEAISDKHSNI